MYSKLHPMVTSPPQTAVPAFSQTWHETDTAFLDPTALPVAKIPRAWERKQETKISRDGKHKKVWRRYTLRSQPASTASADEDEVEEGSVHNRAVKKLRVRLEGIEQVPAKSKGKQRTFKNTRWDRRKSVLPRKRRAPRRVNSETADDSDTVLARGDMVAEDAADSVNEDEILVQEQESLPGDQDKPAFLFAAEEECEQQTDEEISTRSTPSASELQTATPPSGQQHEITPMQRAASPRTEETLHLPTQIDRPAQQLDASELDQSEVNQISLRAHMVAEGTSDPLHVSETEDDADVVVEDSPEETALPQEHGSQGQTSLGACQISDSEIVDISTGKNETYCEDSPDEEEVFSASANDLKHPADISQDVGRSEIAVHEGFRSQPQQDASDDNTKSPPDENCTLTEEHMQLEIQQDMEMPLPTEGSEVLVQAKGHEENPPREITASPHIVAHLSVASRAEQEIIDVQPQVTVESTIKEEVGNESNDIALGLTLPLCQPCSTEPVRRKLRCPSPPPVESVVDDPTTTIQLDDDTALLKDFLTRAAASKANKSTHIARRSSLQNRRDSGAVRQALQSPRRILEAKDPNSPSKYDNELTLDLSQTLTLNIDQQPPLSPIPNQVEAEGLEEDNQLSFSSRRSTRTRKSRLPHLASSQQQPQTPRNISLRRTDGGEPIVLKRTEAQELGLLTRANTRKNKQGAVAVSLKLLKLSTANTISTPDGGVVNPASDTKPKKKNVRWDEQLTYFQESTETLESVTSAVDAESLATLDELNVAIITPSAKGKSKGSKDKKSTPRLRRVRGLGAANGTPGKGLLAPASLLPPEIQEEKEASQSQHLAMPSKVKKMKLARTADTAPQMTVPKSQLPSLGVAPVGIEQTNHGKEISTKELKSHLATPKKVKLSIPKPTAAQVPSDGKENQQGRGFGIATPKKVLPLPQIIVPPAVETGLPRRRAGRKG
ncbi:uncharacterized protein BDR25DRAFT_306619 [Lindgomyces ingoldianus]|uniref:Uncharacterized protein n=1 Tax=Lindgomyces ingoldianus TaxID=673940 RepID=A0ACB6QF35_9PLEO|nr:uncharacterized protein BDR25DRAFT_306619 [Lindgomyces ingoldianus]KAF2465480.1 hypothetical protein BDR25DRAFT_306619 [Lindgomyces ingoldianus]